MGFAAAALMWCSRSRLQGEPDAGPLVSSRHDPSKIARMTTTLVAMLSSPSVCRPILRAHAIPGANRLPRCLRRPRRHGSTNPNGDAFGEDTTLDGQDRHLLHAGKVTWDNAFRDLAERFKTIDALLDKEVSRRTACGDDGLYTRSTIAALISRRQIPLAEAPKICRAATLRPGNRPIGHALKFVHRGSYDRFDMPTKPSPISSTTRRSSGQDTFIEEYVTDPVKSGAGRAHHQCVRSGEVAHRLGATFSI